MRKTAFSRYKRHLLKRGQSGQALVILAISFIALLAFVGIVTDVSLLFVRYSSLRRAVDAAAVAAAGQMRRVADPDPVAFPDEGQAISIANLNLAARQFIEVYGLNPSNVLVETCYTQNFELQPSGIRPGDFRPLDSAGVPMYLYDSNGLRTGPNPAANPDDIRRYEQLCTPDELKLVRVTAQIESPTVFLRLLGYPQITLTAAAISQTAVIDVVLIFDVSESMLMQTEYRDWEAVGRGWRYVPPQIGIDDIDNWGAIPNRGWSWLIQQSQNQILADPNFTVERFVPAGTPPEATANGDVRPHCQVRLWPPSVYNFARIPRWLRDEYTAAGYTSLGARSVFHGFVPTYDFYGCCNDPNGDGDFSDAVCQPFRQARDAAEGFLSRLDFIRGDRLAMVTFDREAYLVDPDGSGPQSPMIETERDLITGVPETSRRGALETLRSVVGVLAEPSRYTDINNDGRWDGYQFGDVYVPFSDADNYFGNTVIGQMREHPVINNCPFHTAALDSRYSLVKTYPDGTPRLPPNNTLLDEIMTPAWFEPSNPYRRFWSYEFAASCAGTNTGGALARASNVLYLNGRREGTVWIMVLFSDGAAGASNPVTRTDGAGNQPLAQAADPYFQNGLGQNLPLPGEYGGFGICPYGTPTNPGELLNDLEFPFCSDEDPSTRTFCTDAPGNPDLRPINITPECEQFYDVDDYARDWADWIGLANLPNTGVAGRSGEERLPTIFTIGFGLIYDRNPRTNVGTCDVTDVNCIRNAGIRDYLAEELMRYIADVGDNNRIDDDYWQQMLGADRIPNPPLDWGPRGPCEIPNGIPGVYAPIAPRTSCGNYYWAPSGPELEQVFNEIASRMFTRISQ